MAQSFEDAARPEPTTQPFEPVAQPWDRVEQPFEPIAQPFEPITQSIEPLPIVDSPPRHDLTDLLGQLTDDDPVPSRGASDRSPTVTSTPQVGAALSDPRDLERPTRASDIVITSEGGLSFDPTFASFAKRAIAVLVDNVILGAPMLPGFVVGRSVGSALGAVFGIVLALVGFVAINVVAAKAIATNRQWIGNRIAGTFVVDNINGANLDFPRALTRLIVRHLISPVLLIGFIVAFSDGQRRTFHDRVASSVVTTRQREVWTAS
jgi:uncharacterized RDD family membrane protein YckC